MTNFKKQAEDWAEKEIKDKFLKESTEDMLDLMTYGRIAYHVDKEGNQRKLSRQEVFDLITDELVKEYNIK